MFSKEKEEIKERGLHIPFIHFFHLMKSKKKKRERLIKGVKGKGKGRINGRKDKIAA